MSNLEERVTALEAEVTRLREQSTDTHTLAAHADRDVAEFRSELRAQTRLISALRETQVEQVQELTGLHEDVTALRTEMITKFDQVHGGLDRIVTILGTLSEQADES